MDAGRVVRGNGDCVRTVRRKLRPVMEHDRRRRGRPDEREQRRVLEALVAREVAERADLVLFVVDGDLTESEIEALRANLQALEAAAGFLRAGQEQLLNAGAGELLAEDLRQCQASLGEITGALSSDELLGKIFSSFCIGK